MTPLSDSYAALLLDYATGALDPAARLVVESYLEMRPEARTDAWMVESLGGALLEVLSPSPLQEGAGVPVWRPGGEQRASFEDARAAVRAAATAEDDGKRWRWRMPGLRVRRLPVPGASLMRISSSLLPQAGAPFRDDLTLILRGACEAGEMRYGPGEIIISGEEPERAPRVIGPDACVCLRANDNPGRAGVLALVLGEAGLRQ